ncbi:hypothetical protein [Novosphingobium sp. MMS21-SN21R]|uniref:hypothetical protein n=1 Tax=Novosphingobium sp. MMS21-SN21R TaxID=2969298 RepID=UPI0028869542|nr:hypothetical protein [Novosphingobium sp. MMS21-SN21R]MDT0509407.1 hypothetical protein [Novosphingobium sp. MMS21-SN21R]
MGRVDFANSIVRADGAVQGLSSREGQYFPGYRNAISGYQGFGAGGDASRDNSDKFKIVTALDTQTAVLVWLQTTPAYKMVTPVTSRLYATGSDSGKLKTQLGISGSLFGMVSNPDLSTYDAIAEAASGDGARAADAARMAAANVRVLAINAGLSAIAYRDDLLIGGVSIGFNDGGEAHLSRCLRDAPNQFIFTNDRMVGVAQCFKRNPNNGSITNLRTSTWQAVAHLINAYAAALPVRLETSADRARWMLGLNGYLVPAIAQVTTADSDAASASALAVTTQTILDETARYVEHYGYNPTGLFMPGPDFVSVASGATRDVPFEDLRRTDWLFGDVNGGLSLNGTIQSASVPAANTSQLSIRMNASSVSVTVATGFRGSSWFDYVTRSSAGEDRTARVYVRAY